MAKEWEYRPGDWWLICDVCSKKIHASESKQRWDGFMVCPNCFETRHPQDFIRTKKDKISVPFSRPRPVDVFIPGNYSGGFGDGIFLLERLTPQFTANRSLAESITVSDTLSYTVVVNYSQVFSDTVSITDNLNITGQLSYTLLDSVTTSDNLAYTLGLYINESLVDTVTVTDNLTYLLTTGSSLINSSAINTFKLG